MNINFRISFILFAIIFLGGCKENLLRLKSETEANKILLSLRESGVNASKVLEAAEWVIRVDESQFTDALGVLDRKRLYGRVASGERKAESDLFATHAQKTSEMLERISESLSESILMIPGVIDARVHIYKEEYDSILNISHKQSASVVLVSEERDAINHEQIKVIVSKGAGVPLEFVAVVESVEKVPLQEANIPAVALIVPTEEIGGSKSGSIISDFYSKDKLLLVSGLFLTLGVSILLLRRLLGFVTKRKDINAITKILES